MKIYPIGQSIQNRRVVKWGIDPTGNRLHIGHFVAIRFLRKMLKEHRDVVIVIGDLTASIGDPSGTIKERPLMEPEIIKSNAESLQQQLQELLPSARFYRNSNSRNLEHSLISALKNFTVAELLDRSAFQNRSVRASELIVPVLQGLDSVNLEAELEVGGEDQEFNFAITRKLQELWHQKPEVCVLLPIIRGTDGSKMSKSLGNCVYLDDGDIRGKIMSIPDDVMDECLPLMTDTPKKELPEHPKTRKEFLADEIIRQLTIN